MSKIETCMNTFMHQMHAILMAVEKKCFHSISFVIMKNDLVENKSIDLDACTRH
jgi:hypothetical protein